MKELILLAGLTLLASKSISQSVTKTNNNHHKDSVVVLSVDIARQVITELEDGDHCYEERDIIKSDLAEKNKIIVLKDTTIARQGRIIASFEKSMVDYTEIDSLNQATIRNVNIKLKREVKRKNAWRYIAGFFALVAIIVK